MRTEVNPMTASMIDGALTVASLCAMLVTMVWSFLVNDTVEAMQVAGNRPVMLTLAASNAFP